MMIKRLALPTLAVALIGAPAQAAVRDGLPFDPDMVETLVALDDAETGADATQGAMSNADAAPVDPQAQTTEQTQAQTPTTPDTYDPVADATLPAPAAPPESYDPLEKYNRKMHRLNNAVDRRIAKPLARFYVRVVPRPVRLGVSNFFSNLGQPVSAINALLQGKPKQAGQSLGRFVMNATLGLGGVLDPATAAKIPNRNEDFGQTLGVWGWKKSRYVELPLFGPRTVRDVFGMVGDAPLSPMRRIENDVARVSLQGLQLVDIRTQLMSTDSFREGATDDYALVRDAWLQRRQYQIFGEDGKQTDEALPDYLRDDNDDPTVPVNAMPGLPTTP